MAKRHLGLNLFVCTLHVVADHSSDDVDVDRAERRRRRLTRYGFGIKRRMRYGQADGYRQTVCRVQSVCTDRQGKMRNDRNIGMETSYVARQQRWIYRTSLHAGRSKPQNVAL